MQVFRSTTSSILRSRPVSRLFSSTAAVRKSAIVTGAGQGIGRAIALRLANDGFDICVNDLERNANMTGEVVAEIKATGRNAVIAHADVSKRGEVEVMVQTSVDELGPLNVIISNAGIAQVKSLLELTEEDIRRMMETNIYGVINCGVVAAKTFIKQGDGGKIVNACSIVAQSPFLLLPHYSASKAAVHNLTKSFAMEFAPYGITSNAYAPGVVASNMWTTIDQGMCKHNHLPLGENFKKMKERILLGRTSVPSDIAKTVSFLAGPDSDYMTGQILGIDGGIL